MIMLIRMFTIFPEGGIYGQYTIKPNKHNVGCAHGAVISTMYCHMKVLGSIPDQGKTYMENFCLVSTPGPLGCDE